MLRLLPLAAWLVLACATAPLPTESPTRSPTPAPTSTPSSTGTGPIDPAELQGLITFSADDGVWVANADGSDRHQLTTDGGFDPTWSLDGVQIAYRLLLAEDDGEIWIINADGSDAHNLVNDPDFSDWGPAWSPDGTTIAFDSNRQVGLTIWLMSAGGGGDHALTDTAAYDMGPAWSPDGEWISYHTQADHYPDVVESGMGDEMEIHLVRPDGSDDHAITADNVEDSFATWSPDGRFLIWSRHGELVASRPDGSGMIELGSGNFPAWIALPAR